MISYSKCKINLGLSVIARRDDGYSDIESVLYPVGGLCDIVEVVRADEFAFSGSGIVVDCDAKDNLCVRALRLIEREYGIDGRVKIHLHKNTPFGAGLGAGSSNGVEVLRILNSIYDLQISDEVLKSLAGELGSDMPFFVDGESAVACGRGELLRKIDIDLRGKYLLIVKPDVGISTAMAYSMVVPQVPLMMPSEAVKLPIEQWRGVLKNDFEGSIFAQFGQLARLKEQMYQGGAIYASMSGSGSSIYGIFGQKPELRFEDFWHLELIT